MSPVFIERLNNAFALYEEFTKLLDEPLLQSKLATLPSNTIGQQLWCVIGARESYTVAVEKGTWDGFRCSLRAGDLIDKQQVLQALRDSAERARKVITAVETWTIEQERLAFQWLEHEIQHHGQLIRYIYGIKIPVPASWKTRYNLD